MDQRFVLNFIAMGFRYRKIVLLHLIISWASSVTFGQGQFAGQMKAMIGQSFQDSKMIPSLEGYEFQEGSLISGVDDPEEITVDVFVKGKTWVVFFSVMRDTISHAYTVMDVLEVSEVQDGWAIRTTFCRQQGNDNVEIVALVRSTNEEYFRNVKQAWRFSRDKRRFQMVNPKEVDCRQEG